MNDGTTTENPGPPILPHLPREEPTFFPRSPQLPNSPCTDAQHIEVDDRFVTVVSGGLIGTRRGLVNRLITGDDFHYKKAFLTSYRAFTTVDELLQLLFEEFQYEWSQVSDTEKRVHISNSVVALLKLWLDESHIGLHNKILLVKLRGFAINFANSFQESSVFKTSAQGLNQLIDSHIDQLLSPPRDITSTSSNSTRLETIENPSDIPPHLLAEALTYLGTTRYRNIKETDYFDWLEDPNTSNAVSLFIEQERKLCFWALRTILRQYRYSQRRVIIHYFLDVVQKCIELRNFSSACSILNGLTSTAITDLKRTYNGLDPAQRKAFKKVKEVINLTDNFKAYRAHLATRRECVPWLQIHLHDLKLRHRGEPMLVDEHGQRGLINFVRCYRIHMFLEELASYKPMMDSHKDHDSDIAFAAKSVVEQLDGLTIDSNIREWVKRRSQTLKWEEQVDFDEYREELTVIGMNVSTPVNVRPTRPESPTSLEQRERVGSTGTTQVIFPPDPFDRNSTHCLDGLITNVSSDAVARGGFSEIYTGYLGDKKVAIKVIRPFDNSNNVMDREKLIRRLRREYTSWTWVKHPIVLQCLGYAYDVVPNSYGLGHYKLPRLISPWMSAGTLTHYMKDRPGLERLKALVDIAEGLAFLHEYIPSIIHGDIRGGNILMTDDGRPCLSDFGLAKVLKEGGMTTKDLGGTIRWVSPELFKDAAIPSTESDVWAYAMTILEIMSGQLPYAVILGPAAVLFTIMRGELPTRPNLNVEQGLSDKIWAVCQKCWNSVPRQRPSMREVHGDLHSLITNASRS